MQCVDLTSGRQQWQLVLPEMRRIVGLVDKKLLIETAAGFLGLDSASGKTEWRHDAAGLLHGQLCGAPGGLLFACREKVGAESWRPCLVWLDVATGREVSRSPLPNLSDKVPYLGPLVTDGDRIWTFFGRNRDPTAKSMSLCLASRFLPTLRLRLR